MEQGGGKGKQSVLTCSNQKSKTNEGGFKISNKQLKTGTQACPKNGKIAIHMLRAEQNNSKGEITSKSSH